MIKYDVYRLLNESLGMYSLGVSPIQSLGIQSNMPGFGEAGMPPELSAKKGKKPPFGGGDEDPGMAGPPIPGGDAPPPGEGPPMDDMGGDMDPMGGEEGGEMGDELGGDELGGEGEMGGDIAAKIAELEAALDQLKAMIGGGDEGADLDADLDHDDDLGDLGGDEDLDGMEGGPEGEEDLEGEPEDDEEPELPFKKGKATPFMKKGMKKEAAENKDGKMKDVGGKPTFLMKKAQKCGDGMEKKVILGKAKKCSGDDTEGSGGGMMPMKKGCKKCNAKMDKKMHKEATGYERPKPLDNSEGAWLKSIHSQLAQSRANQKFDDGMANLKKEDLLLPPPNGGLESVPEVRPGEVGYAPQQAVGGDLGFTTEAIQDIVSRLARLEKDKYQ